MTCSPSKRLPELIGILTSMSNKICFEELRPYELQEIIKNSGIIYLPLGTLEWHQHHLPFGVDSYISSELCQEACKRTGGCVIPPLYFGTDREHKVRGKILHGMDARAGRVLPGSIYFLKQDFFYKFLKQIAINISQQGFKILIIVSAHSGIAQQRTLEKLIRDKIDDLQIIIFPGKQFAGSIDHAGKIETQLLLALKPNLVDLDRLEKPYEAMGGEDPLLAKRKDGVRQFKEIVNQIVAEVSKYG